MDRRISDALKIPEGIRIPILGGIVYKLLNCNDNRQILKEKLSDNPLNSSKRDVKVTVSLTSYPKRIHYVHLAIKSLMIQSYPADQIILWLASSQFPDRDIPKELSELIQYGLQIRWCDDLYGHKKYYYCVQNQSKNEVIITFDDDIIYPKDAIKSLIEMHKKYPNCIVCERAQSIDYDMNGIIRNPGKWKVLSNIGVNKPSFSLNPSPGGGCLIPFGAFYKDAIDKELIRTLAFKNDDLWYMFMAAENGIRTIKTKKYHKIFSVIDGTQIDNMARENVIGDKNVGVFSVLEHAYPTAFRRIVTDTD